jgi:hypothetical protein
MARRDARGASQAQRDGNKWKWKENMEAKESLYRDPVGLNPTRKDVTSHRKRPLVGRLRGGLQA